MEIKKITIELAGTDVTNEIIDTISKAIRNIVIKECKNKNIAFDINKQKISTQKIDEAEKLLQKLKKYYKKPYLAPSNPDPSRLPDSIPEPYIPDTHPFCPIEPGDNPNTFKWKWNIEK